MKLYSRCCPSGTISQIRSSNGTSPNDRYRNTGYAKIEIVWNHWTPMNNSSSQGGQPAGVHHLTPLVFGSATPQTNSSGGSCRNRSFIFSSL